MRIVLDRMPDVTAASLPYHEPSIVTILVLCAFALGLNIIGHVLDRLIYCGLVGQILVGVAFGQPGGKLLSAGFQDTVVQLGYLGLILLVYEGMTYSPPSIASDELTIGQADCRHQSKLYAKICRSPAPSHSLA